MNASRNYGGVIWTNHALARLKERGINQADAWVAWRRPDQSKYAKSRGAWIYRKRFKNQEVEVVAKKNKKSPTHRTSGAGEEWLILSVWSQVTRSEYSKNRISLLKFIKRLFKVE